MHEENDPIVLDGTVANALLTRFFGKEDGKKHALDLSIKVRLEYFQQNIYVRLLLCSIFSVLA